MLTLVEEIALLTIDTQTGKLTGDGEHSVRYALAGAILFDLALENRIDTDVDKIIVVSDKPIGSPIHDQLLAALAKRVDSCPVRECIEEIFFQRKDLESESLDLLIQKGIVHRVKEKVLWIVDFDRLRLVDGAPRQIITVRLAQAILSDDIPDVRDIMLVSLANACGLLSVVLAPGQIRMRAERISNLCQIETISRNVSLAIHTLLKDIAMGFAGRIAAGI
jgi:Golgi phosphoprotein 3